MDILQTIGQRLTPLAPESIEIMDDSASHAGHAGASDGGHFRLEIVSGSFAGLSGVARHRAVYALLADLIPARIHALSIRARTPEEAGH